MEGTEEGRAAGDCVGGEVNRGSKLPFSLKPSLPPQQPEIPCEPSQSSNQLMPESYAHTAFVSQSQPPRVVVVVSESSTSISPEQRLPVANATRTSISTSVTQSMIDLPRPTLVSSRPPKPCHLSPPTTLRGQQQLGPLPSNPRLTCIHKSSHRPSLLAATDTSHT